ncbi:uncharacterized protein LOC132700061 isoform X2 [Cylas formicarius]|uniref:uncharacterized protein LOC132700061 isoform X2 n=1 Tax=Cylas formicarius TaxID=197179 RepID=UPI002958A84D|nr:uncharacterized protein LOC132700061 isoform X2 [Cylas formicarius]
MSNRNGWFPLAVARNKAEQCCLALELEHLEKEKRTMMRTLGMRRKMFKTKYFKMNDEAVNARAFWEGSYEYLAEKIIQQSNTNNDAKGFLNIEQIRDLLFTDNEVDKEKILCLHLLSAHRAETLAPPRKKYMRSCKIHSPVEKLLERSKRIKNIHRELKIANALPLYTLEVTEFGPNSELINDGRLATRVLINERIRLLIDTTLTTLIQSNSEKACEILAMINDINCLYGIFNQKKIMNFLDQLKGCDFLNSFDSFVLSVPFRVKPIQLDIRTPPIHLEHLLKQIRQNVLQMRVRAETKSDQHLKEAEQISHSKVVPVPKVFRKKMRSDSTDEGRLKRVDELYSDNTPTLSTAAPKKLGRHLDINFIRKNINEAGLARKVEYHSDDDHEDQVVQKFRKHFNRYSRNSGHKEGIAERSNIQPISFPQSLYLIANEEKSQEEIEEMFTCDDKNEEQKFEEKEEHQAKPKTNKRKRSNDINKSRLHLKQTTCPACMEKYKIPLPSPKTPRVKPSSVIPLAPDENPSLKTNRKNRLSMLINKEMFKLQSYEKRFSSEEKSGRGSARSRDFMLSSSSDYLYLSSLELAKIRQEIREKETQKKLEKFLNEEK